MQSAVCVCGLRAEISSELSSGCEYHGERYEWFVFNHRVVVPEYVVDFEYITNVR